MSELRDLLLQCTDDNADKLRKKLVVLRKTLPKKDAENLSYKALRNRLKLSIGESDFSRFVQGGRDMLPHGDHHALVKYLFEHHFWTERPQTRIILDIRDYAFHALALYFNVDIATQDSMATRSIGTYCLYRPATLRPGYYLRGYVTVRYVPESHALATREVHGFGGWDGSRPQQQEYDGYLFRKDKKYLFLSQDEAQRVVRIMFINGVRHEGKAISVMTGTAMEMEMKHIVALPVYLERTEKSEAELRKSAEVIAEKEVPETIVMALTSYQVKDHVVYF